MLAELAAIPSDIVPGAAFTPGQIGRVLGRSTDWPTTARDSCLPMNGTTGTPGYRGCFLRFSR